MTPNDSSVARDLRLADALVGRDACLDSDATSTDEDHGRGQTGIGATAQVATRFVVRASDRIVMVRVQDVDSIEADGNYVRIRVQKESYRFRGTIRALAARLDPSQFVRIHKSSIVNLDRIREIQTWFGGDYVAILTDGRQLRVSRTYARDLLLPIR